ncbi:MAG: ribonuclease R, partial [Verrucomicrobia bacterium]|nr:ribonuclease R [Verrucomicrobiota bacterium]
MKSPVSTDLAARILRLLAQPKYQPLDKVELTKKLGLKSDDRGELKEVLRALEVSGKIARIRKDRYVIPEAADLFTGVIKFSDKGFAFVINEEGDAGSGEDLYIASENTWVALHGDRVVARVMRDGFEDSRGRRYRGAAAGSRREGRVIRILQRANETVVGTLQRSKQFHYVVADDPRFIHNIYVHPGQVALPHEPLVGDKVVVRLEEWQSRHVNPEGKIIETLGPAGKAGVDMLSIIRKYHLPEEFPREVMQAAEAIAEEMDESESAQREDLRHRFILTIDPDDAKDFDDAIEVEQLPASNGWRLSVHIADVSHYVPPGGVLDKEAFTRGNSVYLADRVIPMLPERLSNGVCSLKPHVDRLSYSVFIDFSAGARIRGVRFAKTVIRSAQRLTYKQAFALLQGSPKASPVAESLHRAWKLASLLRAKRFANGSLELDMPEVKVHLDAAGRPVRLEKVENDISHQLIEEFMLVANEVVARELKNRQFPAIYRIHEDPDADRLLEFRDFVQSYDYRVGDLSNRAELQKLLRAVRGKPEEEAIKLALLKSLKRAAYETSPLGHYGLAKVNYTHFTSPIRRYADLLVHRALEQASAQDPRNRGVQKGRRFAGRNELAQMAEHISATERVSADAEKDSTQLKKIEYFQRQLSAKKPESYRAIVLEARSFGLLVELPDVLMTGLIHVSALPEDF